MCEELSLADLDQVQPIELWVFMHGRCLRPTLQDHPHPKFPVCWRVPSASAQGADGGMINFVVSTHRRHNLAAVAQARHLRATGAVVLLILAEQGHLAAADFHSLTWMADVNIAATLQGLNAIVRSILAPGVIDADLADLATFIGTPGRIGMAQANDSPMRALGICFEQLRVGALSRFSGVWVALSSWPDERMATLQKIGEATWCVMHPNAMAVFSHEFGEPHITLMLHSAE